MNQHLKIHIENNLNSIEEGKIFDLSQERLTISEYEWLTDIISKSSFAETIILPKIDNADAGIILSLLNKATVRNSTLMKVDIKLIDPNEEMSHVNKCLYQEIQSRLDRNKKRIFAIHGGGNIGLGLMAEIVSRSPVKYNIIATSNNQLTRHLVNSVNKLWLQHGSSNDHVSVVRHLEMISRESDDIIRLYSEASVAALCVTATVMPTIAKDIAQALITRYQLDGSGIKILVLMNLPNSAKYVRDIIFESLLLITDNKVYAEEILSKIEFVPTVVDRIVTIISEETIKLQLKQQLKKISKSTLRFIVNTDNIEHIIDTPELLIKSVSNFNLKFNLFNAERNFSMYVSDTFAEAYRLPLIKKTNDLERFEAVKNIYINGPHAILAWAGALLGCATIAESIRQPILLSFIKEMMEKEICPIISIEYPEILQEDLEMLEASFLERCAASEHDPVIRVGRDPMRKLDQGGRIRRTLEIAQKHKLNIPTPRLEQGIAAGFLYAINDIDPTNPGCQKISEIYKRNNNSLFAVLCYNGQTSNGDFSGLHPYRDRELIDSILNKFNIFNRWPGNIYATNLSSTSLILSKVNGSVPSISIPKILFEKSDYIVPNLLLNTYKINGSFSIPATVQLKSKFYHNNFRLWQQFNKKHDNNRRTNAFENLNKINISNS